MVAWGHYSQRAEAHEATEEKEGQEGSEEISVKAPMCRITTVNANIRYLSMIFDLLVEMAGFS